VDIVQATSPTELAHIKALFLEYEQWISRHDPDGIDLSFQNFEAELASLPGAYAPPMGRMLLGVEDDQVAGGVCVRPLNDDVCEMKRLYLRPEFAGRGLGERLVNAIIKGAKDIGYGAMRLDTLPYMTAAQALYRKFGFEEIPPYYESPVTGTLFMELNLAQETQ